jgi:hypothetical protein
MSSRRRQKTSSPFVNQPRTKSPRAIEGFFLLQHLRHSFERTALLPNTGCISLPGSRRYSACSVHPSTEFTPPKAGLVKITRSAQGVTCSSCRPANQSNPGHILSGGSAWCDRSRRMVQACIHGCGFSPPLQGHPKRPIVCSLLFECCNAWP